MNIVHMTQNTICSKVPVDLSNMCFKINANNVSPPAEALISEVDLETLVTNDSCSLFSLRSGLKLWRFPHHHRDDLVAQQH